MSAIFAVPCVNGTGPAASDVPAASCADLLERAADGAAELVAFPVPHPLITIRPTADSVSATGELLSIPANVTDQLGELPLKATNWPATDCLSGVLGAVFGG